LQLKRLMGGGNGRPQPLPIDGSSAPRSNGKDDGVQVCR
jgi:hypothetical protein